MDYLKKHSILHMSDSKFCCSECGELCGSAEGLKKHKKQSHNPPKQENASIELNSFEDLALQLPSLPSIGGDNVLESISELQAVSLDGGKTIMILNECAEQVYTEVCLEQEGGEVAVVGEAEVLHMQPQATAMENFPEQTEVLYAVEYWNLNIENVYQMLTRPLFYDDISTKNAYKDKLGLTANRWRDDRG